MGGYYYITKQGDMWDYIAWVVYGNERLFEKLLNAEENREIISTYMFSAGEKVWCPKIEEKAETNNMPPWRDSK